jgi:hypothetical protein
MKETELRKDLQKKALYVSCLAFTSQMDSSNGLGQDLLAEPRKGDE